MGEEEEFTPGIGASATTGQRDGVFEEGFDADYRMGVGGDIALLYDSNLYLPSELGIEGTENEQFPLETCEQANTLSRIGVQQNYTRISIICHVDKTVAVLGVWRLESDTIGVIPLAQTRACNTCSQSSYKLTS